MLNTTSTLLEMTRFTVALVDLVERVVFSKTTSPAIGLDHLACVDVEGMRPDIVGARQREPLAAVLDQPGNEFVACAGVGPVQNR